MEKWTLEETLESSCNFETRKVLNRSSVKIPVDFISSIELNGLESETLETVKIPVYKYKTQVTLHGVFNDISNDRIGGYKNIVLNGNKTLGIRYNAIDYEKKIELFNALRVNGNYKTWVTHRNSTEFNASVSLVARSKEEITEKTRELLELQKRIDSSLFVGTKNIYRYFHPALGYMVELVLNVGTIRKENVGKLFTSITGKDYNEFNAEQKAIEEKEEQERLEKKAIAEKKESDIFSKNLELVKSLNLNRYTGGTGYYIQPVYSAWDEKRIALLCYVYSNKAGTALYTKAFYISSLQQLNKETASQLVEKSNIHKDTKLTERKLNDCYSIKF